MIRPSGHCVATLSYVFNHHERELAGQLTGMQHDHHDLTVAAMSAISITKTAWVQSFSGPGRWFGSSPGTDGRARRASIASSI